MYNVDVVMARAKRIYILIIRVNKLFSFFSSHCFLKEIKNVYRLEKAVETCGSLRLVFPQHFSFSQTFTRVSTTR